MDVAVPQRGERKDLVEHALANASVLDSVDARTRLAGSNMMELLLFSLGTEEVFGINVFKVREITRTPAIARAPNLPPSVAGLVSLRGSIIPVISLSAIVGGASPSCSNEVMMERVQRTQIFNYYEEDQDLLEDVLTENQQAIQMTNINTEILSSMMDAFASIISNNLNSVMKALAAITIIMSLPTIVSSFYGMNVDLPFQAHPLAFWFTVGIAAAFIGLAVLIFYRRDWF